MIQNSESPLPGGTPTNPHARTVEEVASGLVTNPSHGLSASVAAQRRERHGPNQIAEGESGSQLELLVEQFKDPLVYLLAAAIVISVAVWLVEGGEGAPLDAIVIGGIVILNAAIGFIQERKAETAVAELSRMVVSHATVIRDGMRAEIDSVDLVPGDVVVLGEGDAVPADGRVVHAKNLSVAEAVLTGESESVMKGPGPVEANSALGDRTSMVFSATSVSTGSGRFVVTGTGMDTEVGGIATLLDEAEVPPTPLEKEMGKVGRMLGIAVVIITVIVVAVTFLVSDVSSAEQVVELMLVGVSLAVAAVPEGLPAVLSLVLAIGVRRMADRNAILKRLAFAETLGSTTVICTDKTGTLTRNEMSVRRLTTVGGEFNLTGSGYSPEGDLAERGEAVGDREAIVDQARQALRAGVLASDADVSMVEGQWKAIGDVTEAALVVAARKAGASVGSTRSSAQRLDEIPFSSTRKRMTILSRDPDTPGRILLITKGAPEVVLGLCASQGSTRDNSPITDADRDRWYSVAEGFASEALRTLAVAVRVVDASEFDPDTPLSEGDEIIDPTWERDLIMMGIAGIMDPPRDEVAPAVKRAQEAGIRVIMITGDHPTTASRIASEVGIGGSGGAVVTGPQLDESEGLMARSLESARVYSRVSPKHKLELVESLQAAGHVVAMTGDGVNDAPALKAADIGVAMGIAGSDVSKGAADMILTDDNFATIVDSVEEGRTIFANIAAFIRYLLSSNVGEVFTMFLGVIFASVIGLKAEAGGIVVPLVATQILWINVLTDIGPALALGVDPVDPSVMMHGPRTRADRLIDRSMTITIAILGLTMAIVTLAMLDMKLPGGFFEGSSDLATARTGAFTVLVLAQLFNAFNARSKWHSAFFRPFSNIWLVGAVGLSFVLQIAVVHLPILNEAFSTAPLSLGDWLLAAVLASSVLWVAELDKLWNRSR